MNWSPPPRPEPQVERFVPDSLFLESLEGLGVEVDALKAVFPIEIWPAQWRAEPPEQTTLDELAEPNRPYHAENDPIAADQAPQEPTSAPREDEPDQQDAENLDEEAIPW